MTILCLQVVREDANGIIFRVGNVIKLLVVIISSWDELSLDKSKKGNVLLEVTDYLTLKSAGFGTASVPNTWKSVKICLAGANVMPLHIVQTRKGETKTKKISKVL
jgi:hypothetical protein